MDYSVASPRPFCPVKIGRLEVVSLIDTGSDISVLSQETFNRLGSQPVIEPVEGATSVTGQRLEITGRVRLPIQIGWKDFTFDFYVIPNIVQPMILGSDFLVKHEAKLDMEQKTLSLGNLVVLLQQNAATRDNTNCLMQVTENMTVPPRTLQMVPCQTKTSLQAGTYLLVPLENSDLFLDQPGLMSPSAVVHLEQEGLTSLLVCNNTNMTFTLKKGQVCARVEAIDDKEVSVVETDKNDGFIVESPHSKFNLEHIPHHQRVQLLAVLDKYKNLFVEKDTELGCTDKVQMTINTKDHPPIYQKPYRTPYSQRHIIEEHIADMLKAGIISPSTSPWSSPLLLVPKGEGFRFCIPEGTGLPDGCAEQAAVVPQGMGVTQNEAYSAEEILKASVTNEG